MLDIDLTHSFGDFNLKAAFHVEARGLIAVSGPSGAGKTSLINMVAGLLRPDFGRLVINGTVLCDTARGIYVPPHRRHTGYVFQDALLFPHLTVRGNLTYGAPRETAAPAIGFDRVVEVLGLGHLLARAPHTLSGGERQRVALGRALLSHPKLLLMDEPLASLDAARKHEVLLLIEQIRDLFAIPILYISHSMEEILRLADSIILMDQGQVLGVGPPEEIFSRLDFGAITARQDAGAVIVASVRAHDAEFNLTCMVFAGGNLFVPQVPVAAGTQLRLRILARDISLALTRPTDSSVLNIFSGTVLEIGAPHGAYVEVRVDIGVPVLARITCKSLQHLGLTSGSKVFAMVKAVAMSAPA